MKIISVCSGKGGVGKTTVALNLAAALHTMNKKVIVIDANLTTSHIGLMLGMYNAGKTFNNFLRGEMNIREAIQVHRSGIEIIPASLELSELKDLETKDIKQHLREAFGHYDFVLIDSAPGIGKEALIALRACDEVLFVANPLIPSVVDVLKIKNLSHKIGFYNAGIVINRVEGKKYELNSDDIFRFTELPLAGKIPFDHRILKSSNERTIPFFAAPKSKSSHAFLELAHRVAGLPFNRRGLI